MGPLAIPLIQAGAGLVQSIIGGGKARKAQKELEQLQTPTYTQNQSILDFYNKALQRNNVDPYSSNLYKMQQQGIQRSTAQGLGGLQDRRSGLAGISSLVQGQNDSLLRAGVAAEENQNQRFGQLGQAAAMKAQEDNTAFHYNQVAPYEKQYNLLAMKASGANQTTNAGLQNIFGGLGNASQISLAKQMYGSSGSGNVGGQQNRQAVQIGTNPDGSPKFGYR